MVNHPVLFETFVRIETARQVWEQIKKAQPSKLYFYSNKGRAEIPGEIEKTIRFAVLLMKLIGSVICILFS